MANYTILLIDYEPRSIERFRDPLIAAGYRVEIATDGVSGIEAFHRLSPDMVLVEAMIPKKHGFEVCQELKRTPHGRQTPVLITTGVYKGRKYRTQALHIYGCDEYIEKPIAPTQLLEVVGRFLGSRATDPSPRTEPTLPASDMGAGPAAREKVGAAATATPSSEPAAPESKRTKPTPVPQATTRDDTEFEIMARLDAILPGGGGAIPPFTESSQFPVIETIEEDPFAQMRAELNAELGPLSAALAFEPAPLLESMPEPISSDQAASQSVFEALPVPDAEVPIALQNTAPRVAADERPGQVVSFDSKRVRKSKKSETKSKARPPQRSRVASAPEPVTPKVVEPAIPGAEIRLPRGTIVESDLDAAAGRGGLATWLWMAAGVVAIGAVYFVFSHGLSSGSDASPLAPEPTQSVGRALSVVSPPPAAAEPTTTANAPAPPANIPVANAPVESPSRLSESSTTVPSSSKPVVGAVKTPTPKKAQERTSTAPLVPSAAKPAVASAPRQSPSDKPTAKSEPLSPVPAPIETARGSQPELPASADPDAGATGVEAVPDTAAAVPSTTIAPGTLIPIDVADTIPFSLSRKVPVYSKQAKHLRASGTVVMNVLVNEHGTVDQVVLVRGVPGADLNDAAMLAAKTWTYLPATKNGVPVKVWKSEQVVFKL